MFFQKKSTFYFKGVKTELLTVLDSDQTVKYLKYLALFDANRSKDLFCNLMLNLSRLLQIIYDHHFS